MQLGFSKNEKSLSLVIHPSEINDTIIFLESLRNGNEKENRLISEVNGKMSSHTDPDEPLIVTILGGSLDFSIRFVADFISLHKALNNETSKIEEILSVMEICSLKVN